MSEAYTGRRITADEVAAAYRETGLEPMRGAYFDHVCGRPHQACGLGVLYFKSAGLKAGDSTEGMPFSASDIGIVSVYEYAFADGFDGKICEDDTPLAILGYRDGTAAALRIFAEAPR